MLTICGGGGQNPRPALAFLPAPQGGPGTKGARKDQEGDSPPGRNIQESPGLWAGTEAAAARTAEAGGGPGAAVGSGARRVAGPLGRRGTQHRARGRRTRGRHEEAQSRGPQPSRHGQDTPRHRGRARRTRRRPPTSASAARSQECLTWKVGREGDLPFAFRRLPPGELLTSSPQPAGGAIRQQREPVSPFIASRPRRPH